MAVTSALVSEQQVWTYWHLVSYFFELAKFLVIGFGEYEIRRWHTTVECVFILINFLKKHNLLINHHRTMCNSWYLSSWIKKLFVCSYSPPYLFFSEIRPHDVLLEGKEHWLSKVQEALCREEVSVVGWEPVYNCGLTSIFLNHVFLIEIIMAKAFWCQQSRHCNPNHTWCLQ